MTHQRCSRYLCIVGVTTHCDQPSVPDDTTRGKVKSLLCLLHKVAFLSPVSSGCCQLPYGWHLKQVPADPPQDGNLLVYLYWPMVRPRLLISQTLTETSHSKAPHWSIVHVWILGEHWYADSWWILFFKKDMSSQEFCVKDIHIDQVFFPITAICTSLIWLMSSFLFSVKVFQLFQPHHNLYMQQDADQLSQLEYMILRLKGPHRTFQTYSVWFTAKDRRASAGILKNRKMPKIAVVKLNDDSTCVICYDRIFHCHFCFFMMQCVT